MQLHQRIFMFAALLPIAIAGGASAERPDRRAGDFGMHPDRGPERFIEQHADELGLDADTRAAIEKIVADSRSRAEEFREAASEDRDAMRKLLQEPLPDEAEVMAMNDKISASHQKMKSNRLEAMMAIRKLLTEEQRAKLVAIRDSKAGRRGHGGPLGACRQDIEDLCSEAEPGRASLQCIVERWDVLSDECRASFERVGKERSGPRKRGGPVAD